MKKFIALTAGALLALPAIASAQIVGECSACHTMHNSEQGKPVALAGNTGELRGEFVTDKYGNTSFVGAPIQNLLKLDCVGCHAKNGASSAPTELLGESSVPQVMHSGGTLDGLAGGNFRFGLATAAGGNRNVHNVNDFVWGYAIDQVGEAALSGPPGITRQDSTHSGKFSVTTPFDAFTCAGARGCHGTRSQLLEGYTSESPTNTDGTVSEAYAGTMRTGISAVTGAHHLNTAGLKQDNGYTVASAHKAETVAAGYRFIPGLWGVEAADWRNTDATNRNVYYGIQAGLGNGCGVCHIERDDAAAELSGDWGMGTRMAMDSTIKTPNNSMSGFCSTCHGDFHSSGAAGDDATAEWTDSDADGTYDTFTGLTQTDGDYVKNGISGAFLRHPSDYVIPVTGEYGYYDGKYTNTAPVAQTDLAAGARAVATGSDLVMCLSCHVPHGSEFDYLLRFDYSAAGNVMDAGKFADQATSFGQGGCLACHSAKGVDKDYVAPTL